MNSGYIPKRDKVIAACPHVGLRFIAEVDAKGQMLDD